MSMHVPTLWLCHLVSCLLILQSILLCYGEPHDCPKGQFLSDHGCQPCSLCNPVIAQVKNLIREECRGANPDLLADGRVLWCDDPRGPFPECPSIDHSALQTPCSKSCKANFRTFAPGCICTVGCSGKPSQVVLCTDKFQWNCTDIPSQCKVTTPSTAAPRDKETTAPKPVRYLSYADLMGTLVGSGLFVSLSDPTITICAAFILMVMGYLLYLRFRSKLCPSKHSRASGFCLRRKRKWTRPFNSYEETFELSSECSESSCNEGEPDGGSTGGAPLTSADCNEETELTSVAMQDPSSVMGGVQQRETGRDVDQEESCQALKALMNSHQDLMELSKRFDQEYAFDRITWHDVAIEMLGWDYNDLHHTEYKCQPQSGSPGAGPMYQVLQAAREQGKGLLDLIDCLRRQSKKQGAVGTMETEEVLMKFWQNWKSKQPEAQC